MKSKKVSIIGIRGRYGSHLEKFLKHYGYDVIGSDVGTEKSNEEVVRWSDVVIFSVPIHLTVEIIGKLLPLSRPDQLWMDLTTVKVLAVQTMLKSCAEVVGLHPLFAPPDELTWEGKIVAVCPARLLSETWKSWLREFLETTKANILTIGPQEHDAIMLVEQNLTHIGIFMTASIIRSLGVKPDDLFPFATPVSRLLFANIGRILGQDPKLYADIQIPRSLEILDECIKSLGRLREIVSTGDRELFIDDFNRNRDYLGEPFFTKSSQIFSACMKACEQKKK